MTGLCFSNNTTTLKPWSTVRLLHSYELWLLNQHWDIFKDRINECRLQPGRLFRGSHGVPPEALSETETIIPPLLEVFESNSFPLSPSLELSLSWRELPCTSFAPFLGLTYIQWLVNAEVQIPSFLVQSQTALKGQPDFITSDGIDWRLYCDFFTLPSIHSSWSCFLYSTRSIDSESTLHNIPPAWKSPSQSLVPQEPNL